MSVPKKNAPTEEQREQAFRLLSAQINQGNPDARTLAHGLVDCRITRTVLSLPRNPR